MAVTGGDRRSKEKKQKEKTENGKGIVSHGTAEKRIFWKVYRSETEGCIADAEGAGGAALCDGIGRFKVGTGSFP